MDVLEALADADEDLGTNELARRTGINPTSVSRLLATLAASGLVAQDGRTGRYRLGLRMLRYGTAVLARLDVREVARDHLRALTEATGETATLSVPGGGSALTVDFVQSSASVQSVARVRHAVAVPVRNATGALLAVLGVQGPAGRIEAAERVAAVEHLQRAARQLDATFAAEVAQA